MAGRWSSGNGWLGRAESYSSAVVGRRTSKGKYDKAFQKDPHPSAATRRPI